MSTSRNSRNDRTSTPATAKTSASGGSHSSAHNRRGLPSIVISTLVVVALLVVITVIRPTFITPDASGAASDVLTQQVSSKRIVQYCPSQMALADSGSYGDNEFQATTGNLTTAVRYASFGSVFRSTISNLTDPDDTGTTIAAASSDGTVAAANIGSTDAQKNATVFDTRLLSAAQGTGATGTMASWASEGDLEGVSASPCVTTALRQSFLIPSTATGNTQQLIIANPSDKATSVTLTMYGPDGRITMATNSTVSVGAYSKTLVDLSAAAPKQTAAYVTIDSEQTAVAAIVRSQAADGLTPLGSDFAVPLDAASTSQTIAMNGSDDALSLMLYSDTDTTATLTWLGSTTSTAQTVQLTKDRVSVVDLKNVPSNAYALRITSDAAIHASATITQSGSDGQQDYALVTARTLGKQSALAIPNGFNANVIIMNPSETSTSVKLTAYDANGASKGTKTIMLGAGSAKSVAASDFGDNIAAISSVANTDAFTMGMFLSNSTVNDADLAGISYVPATSLTITEQTVQADLNQNIVK